MLLGLVIGRETHGLLIPGHVFVSLPAGRGRAEVAAHTGSVQKLRKWDQHVWFGQIFSGLRFLQKKLHLKQKVLIP